jgi:uracil-DNA glycosylase
MIQAQFSKTFEGWRTAAREFASHQVHPKDIQWNEETLSLFTHFEEPQNLKTHHSTSLKVPAEFIKIAETVSYARDPDRWDLLYRILYRLNFENPNLMNISVDPDISRATHLKISVGKDIHKMHAFVRFKKLMIEDEETYIAWHKPEHLTVKPGTPFFARRFGDKRWSIFTPDESAHWDLKELTFGPGMEQHEFQIQDGWDEVWKTYYKSIFNPSRIKIKMMKSEMSPKYWSSMPETALIDELVREAPRRLQQMAENQNHAAAVSMNKPIEELRQEIKSCQSCPLYKKATHAVFGVGPHDAKIMIVGEQPGDEEDLAGLPFVGPSGEILDQALQKAQLVREKIYLTNAVKHFKWTEHQKMRLHQKPSGREMHACKPWLEAEIAQVKPKIIIALGATAATAVLGRLPKISEARGKIIYGSPFAEKIIVSWHPAAILRAFSTAESEVRTEQLAFDLGLAHA